MWYCTRCGAQQADSAAFCDQCGAPRPQRLGPVEKKKKSKTPLLIGGIVLGLALIALALWFLLKGGTGAIGGGSGKPGIYRKTYSRTTATMEQDSSYRHITEQFYHYDDAAGTGWVEDGDHNRIRELKLNKLGQIVEETYLGLPREPVTRIEYSYDERGNANLVKRFEDGTLVQQQEYVYDEDRAVQHYVLRLYTDGRETRRTEMDFPEKTKGTVRSYQDGTQQGTWMEYVFSEDNMLLRQAMYSPDSRVSIVENRYERLN